MTKSGIELTRTAKRALRYPWHSSDHHKEQSNCLEKVQNSTHDIRQTDHKGHILMGRCSRYILPWKDWLRLQCRNLAGKTVKDIRCQDGPQKFGQINFHTKHIIGQKSTNRHDVW